MDGKIGLAELERSTNNTIADTIDGGISYLNSGLNPFAIFDNWLNSVGRERLGKKLGIDWNTATTADYIKAIVNAIGGLATTVERTAAKIVSKLKVPAGDAKKLAEHLHNANEMGDVDPARHARDIRSAANSINPNEIQVVFGDKITPELVKSVKDVVNNHEFWRPFATFAGTGPVSNIVSKLPDAIQTRVLRTVAKVPGPALPVISPRLLTMRKRGNVEMLFRSVKQMDLEAERVKHAAQPLQEAVASVPGDELQSKILGMALLLGSKASNPDGSLGVKFTEAQLKKGFPQIKPETIEAYSRSADASRIVSAKILKAYETRHDEKLWALNEDLKKATDQKQIDRLNDSIQSENDAWKRVQDVFSNKQYWPAYRKGGHWVSWALPGTDTSVAVAALEHSPATPAGKKELLLKFSEAMQENPKLKKAFQNGEIDPTQDFEYEDKSAQLDRLSKNGIEYMDVALFEALEAVADIDPDVAKSVRDVLDTKLHGDTIRSHMKKREGVAGASIDPVLAANSFIHMAANAVANALSGENVSNALAAVTNNKSPEFDADIASWAQDYVNSYKHPPQTPFANKMNALGFMMALGGVPIFALVQRTQPLTTILPSLAPAYGWKNATTAYVTGQRLADKLIGSEAFKDIREGAIPREIGEKSTMAMLDKLEELIKKENFEKKLGKGKAELLTQTLLTSLGNALESGSLRPSGSNELMEAAGLIPALKSAAGRTLTLPASLSETANRMAALFTYPIAAVKAGEGIEYAGAEGRKMVPGQDLEAMVRTGDELNDINNFVMNRANRAAFQHSANPIIKMASLFKGYIAGYTSLMHFMGIMEHRRAKTMGSSEAQAKLAYMKARMGFDLAAVALAGPQGAVDFMVLSAVIAALGELFKFEPEEILNDYVLKPIANQVKETAKANGADEKTQKVLYDLTKFAITNGLPSALSGVDISAAIRPDLFAFGSNDSYWQKIGGFMFGPAANAAITAAETEKSKSIPTALSKLYPRALKGVVEATTGETKVGKSKEALTPIERAMRALSAQPTRIVIERQKESKRFEFSDQHATVKKKLQDKVDRSVDANGRPDFETLREANRELRQWERDHSDQMRKFGIQASPSIRPPKVFKMRATRERID